MLLKPAFFASAQLRKLSPPEGGSTAGGGTGSGTRVAVAGGAGMGCVVVGAVVVVAAVAVVVGGRREVVAWAAVDVADRVTSAGVDVVAVAVVVVGAAGGEPLPHPTSTRTSIARPTQPSYRMYCPDRP